MVSFQLFKAISIRVAPPSDFGVLKTFKQSHSTYAVQAKVKICVHPYLQHRHSVVLKTRLQFCLSYRVICVCSREMYTESITSSVTKLYISETHNKHAGSYTCVVLDQLDNRVAFRTVTLLLYSKTACALLMFRVRMYAKNTRVHGGPQILAHYLYCS